MVYSSIYSYKTCPQGGAVDAPQHTPRSKQNNKQELLHPHSHLFTMVHGKKGTAALLVAALVVAMAMLFSSDHASARNNLNYSVLLQCSISISDLTVFIKMGASLNAFRFALCRRNSVLYA